MQINKTKKLMFIFICILFFILIPINAEIVSGNFTITPQSVRLEWNGGGSIYIGGNALDFKHMYIQGIENFQGLNTYIHYDIAGYLPVFDSGAPSNGVTQSMVGKLNNINGQEIFYGTIGWQRIYNYLGVEQPGYQYLVIQGWNEGTLGLTGDYVIYIDTNYATLYNPTFAKVSQTGESYCSNPTINTLVIRATSGNCGNAPGETVNVKSVEFNNGYTIVKPSGIGITGYLEKTIGGIVYPSQAFIFDGVIQSLLASQNAVTPSDFNFNVDAQSIIIGVKTNLGTYINSSVLFLPQITYSIQPNPINLNQKPTGIMGGTLTNIKFYSVSDITEGTQHPIFYDNAGVYNYNFLKNSSGYWKAYNASHGYTTNLGTIIPNNLPFTFYEGGERQIKVTTVDVNNVEQYIYVNMTITGGGANEFNLFPIDYINSNFITGATLRIKDIQSQTFLENRTVQTANDCTFYLNTGWYGIYATAPNFADKYDGVIYISGAKTEQIKMYPLISGGSLTNITALINVKTEPNYNPLMGATVKISANSLATDLVKTTSYAGVANFDLINGTTYKVVVTAQGYNTVTDYITPDFNPFIWDIVTTEGSDSPIDYSTLYPTPTITGVPIVTPAAWTNGSAAVCGVVANNASLKDWFKSQLACNGLIDATSQSLVLAGIIVIGCMLFGGTAGKAVGSVIGAIVGFVFALMFGLVPFMALAVIIVLLVLVATIVVFNKL